MRERGLPRSIDIGAMINQKLDDLHISACTSRMKGKNTIEDRVNWLAIIQSVLDEPDVASGGG